ncbi:rhodanese-like domain-containing protein [Crossiella cryophila]|uniref:Rhodanese-related sulfurtransferase n=1 Tax=Crossiella cryophila TaxID=43355 RepID=A0A7W7C8R8_9PSEU|nr:rhodanese-like domain-containing protein [Crossiella cryophila]MBB4676600.1 rhodanese-related sulfurtransferase [Crossiella cryophila]
MQTTSHVLSLPVAEPAVAAAHFAAELAFEADPDDVHRDLVAGTVTGYVLVECRRPEAFAAARIPGAINLPYATLTEENTAHLDRDLVYLCYCESFQCNAATKGAARLAGLGFKVKRLAGGIQAWIGADYPIEGDAVVGGDVRDAAVAGGGPGAAGPGVAAPGVRGAGDHIHRAVACAC